MAKIFCYPCQINHHDDCLRPSCVCSMKNHQLKNIMAIDSQVEVMDYWLDRKITLAFSRQDKGLIAIGEHVDGGMKWVHLHENELSCIIQLSKQYHKEKSPHREH